MGIFFYISFLLYKLPDTFFTFDLTFNYYSDVMNSKKLTDFNPVFVLSLYKISIEITIDYIS